MNTVGLQCGNDISIVPLATLHSCEAMHRWVTKYLQCLLMDGIEVNHVSLLGDRASGTCLPCQVIFVSVLI